MALQTLEESLRSLGLSEEEIRRTFPELSESVGKTDDAQSEPVSGYLSDEDASDSPHDDDDLDAYIEGLTDDDVDTMLEDVAEALGLEEGFIRLRSLSKRKVARKKMKKWLKTSAGRAYARKKKRVAKTAIFQKKQKKHAAKLAARGGPKIGKIFREDDVPAQSEAHLALESMMELQESVDHDPDADFALFARSFNALADVGELAAGSILESNKDGARRLATVAVGAERVLRHMETLGEAVYRSDRESLEATLAEAVDYVGELLAHYDLLEGTTSNISQKLSEAVDPDSVDTSLSIWDAPETVSDAVLENIRKLRAGQ